MQKDIVREVLETPVLGKYDVIVCGGGIGGISAAVAAKRAGASVLLLEKSIVLGGLATQGLISWYEPICDGNGRKIMYGMADELLQLAVRYSDDTLPEAWRGNPDAASKEDKRFATFFSPTVLTLALDNWALEAGVALLLDTVVTSAVMSGQRCDGVTVENKTGRGVYKGKIIIDATGDCDVLHRLGVPCTDGNNYLTYIAYLTDMGKMQKSIEANDILKSRKWQSLGADLWGKGHPEDMPVMSGISAESLTQYVLCGRRLLFEHIKNDNGRGRDITIIPGMAQLRTTRRIKGEYTLTERDEGKMFDDSIGAAGDFAHRGKVYELPYRILYNAGYDNLLTVGRTVSSDGWAWDVTRVIPVCALTGQASGIAAAICAKKNISVKNIGINELQKRLGESGVIIHMG